MNRLYDIFTFSKDFPLIFTQVNFWIFFAVVYTLYGVFYKKIKQRNAYLFLISLFFYYKTSGFFIGILIFSTIVDFFIGRSIYRSNKQKIRYALVSLSVVINLTVLFYFKYAYFFTNSVNMLFHTNYEVFNWLADWGNTFADQNYFTVNKIILPVGISFYTFQTISYSVDIFRKKLKPLDSILDFGFYVSFFPQLVAGPIVRAENFVPQISAPTILTKADFNKGTFMILKGMIKKMIFADFIAMHFLDRVFDNPEMFSGFANIMAMFGYSLQIYGDFSGYTDIAIGLALLMGFKLPVNFNSPYKALNTSDFWKRWHISLSTWLRDYLYIPLGGNRKGSTASYLIISIFILATLYAFLNLYIVFSTLIICLIIYILSLYYKGVEKHINTNINIIITMLLGGLWHGANWKFAIWGGLNGLGILVYKYWRKISPYENLNQWYIKCWKILFTLTFITFTRIYFRGESMDHITKWYNQVWYHMDWHYAWDILTSYKTVFIVMAIGYLTHWLPETTKNHIETLYGNSPIYVKVTVSVFVGIMCYQAFSTNFQPFIYFQF